VHPKFLLKGIVFELFDNVSELPRVLSEEQPDLLNELDGTLKKALETARLLVFVARWTVCDRHEKRWRILNLTETPGLIA